MRQAEAAAILSTSPSKVICNGMGAGGGFYGSGTGDGISTTSSGGAFHYTINWSDLYTPSNLIGCTFEGLLRQYNGSSQGVVNLRIFLNTTSQILANSSKSFVLLDYAFNPDGTTNDQLRREHTSAIWLVAGNSLSRSISWLASYIATTNFVADTPEQQIYVKNPVKALRAYVYNNAGSLSPELPFGNGSGCRNASPSGTHVFDTLDLGGVDDLVVACPSGASGSGNGTDTGGNPAGVYAREYNDCYYAGTRFGPCATIFNATNAPVTTSSTWFLYNYTHTIGWSGGALASIACPVFCNGSINLTASPITLGTTQIAANDAILLSP